MNWKHIKINNYKQMPYLNDDVIFHLNMLNEKIIKNNIDTNIVIDFNECFLIKINFGNYEFNVEIKELEKLELDWLYEIKPIVSNNSLSLKIKTNKEEFIFQTFNNENLCLIYTLHVLNQNILFDKLQKLLNQWVNAVIKSENEQALLSLINDKDKNKLKTGDLKLIIESSTFEKLNEPNVSKNIYKGLSIKFKYSDKLVNENNEIFNNKTVLYNKIFNIGYFDLLNVLLKSYNLNDDNWLYKEYKVGRDSLFNYIWELTNLKNVKISKFSSEYFDKVTKNCDEFKDVIENISKFLKIFSDLFLEFDDTNLKIQNLVKNNNLEISTLIAPFFNNKMSYELSLNRLVWLIKDKQNHDYWPRELKQIIISDKNDELVFKFNGLTDLCVNYRQSVRDTLGGAIKFMYDEKLWNLHLKLLKLIDKNKKLFYQCITNEHDLQPVIKQIVFNGGKNKDKIILILKSFNNTTIPIPLEIFINNNTLSQTIKNKLIDLTNTLKKSFKIS